MNPSLAILSLRGLTSHVSMCGAYEFEDVLCAAFPGSKLYAPRPSPSIQTGLKIKARLAPTGSFGGILDNVFAIEQVDEHEVLLAVVGGVRDLALLGAMKDWRRKSRYAICWLDELWVEEIPQLRGRLRVLEQFDVVVSTQYYTAEKLREELKSPEVMFLPPGVDALGFAPVMEPSLRPIDITNHRVDRRRHTQGHARVCEANRGILLLRQPERPLRGSFALGASVSLRQYSKEVEVFLVPLRQDEAEGPPGQLEFGSRYIEGLAAGCVLLGSRKSTPAFDTFLGWEDAVIEMPFECTNVPEILRSLDSQADRLREISTRNVRQSLEGHDHAHRWKTIVDRLGLSEDYHMSRRQEELARKLNEFGYPTRQVVQKGQQDEQ